MMTPSRILLAAACLAPIVSAFAPLHAQNDPVRKIRFRAVTWSGQLKDVAFESPDGVEMMDLNAQRFTEPKTYRGPSQLTFFRLGEKSSKGAEPSRRFLGSVEVSEDSDTFLLVFLRDEGPQTDTARILAVPAGLPEFPPEYVKVWNFIDHEVLLRLNEESYRVQPRENRLIYSEARGPEDDASGLAFGRGIDAGMAYRPNEQWRQIYRSQWAMAENNRMLVFVYPGGGQRPRVKTITEFLEEPPKNEDTP
jgi:hypothetical protein